MDLKEWAKKEVEMACKRENPNWDEKVLIMDVLVINQL